jgi:hypothetical protein
VAFDIVDLALNNMDSLIEVKEAFDTAPQDALDMTLHDVIQPGTIFSTMKQDRKFDDRHLDDVGEEPGTSRQETWQTTNLEKRIKRKKELQIQNLCPIVSKWKSSLTSNKRG